MKIKVIKKAAAATAQWAGGTTTQLYIFPEDADFKKGDFDFRISTATVTAETSTFTHLPGVLRKLMVLEGELMLAHEQQYRKALKPFEQDTFKGDWLTTSCGKATDFNLMTTNRTTGNLNAVTLLTGNAQLVQLTTDIILLYIHKGKIACADLLLETGDTLVVKRNGKHEHQHQQLLASENAVIIKVEITLSKNN